MEINLIYLDKTYNIPNSSPLEIINKINELIGEDSFFSYFIVDGIEIYEDHEKFLHNNILSINKIEVISKTFEQMINDILLSTKHYLFNAIPVIKNLYNDFYSSENQDRWNKFEQLLEGLQWITRMLEIILNKEPSKISEEFGSLLVTIKDVLPEIEEALINQDDILIGDLIKYEILSNYEILLQLVEKTPIEGGNNDIN